MTTTLPPRGAVRPQDTWDAHSIFPTDAAWEAAYQRVVDGAVALERFRGRLAERPATLADWLAEFEALDELLGKVRVYASLFYEVDTGDQAAAARSSRARSLYARVAAAAAFAEPELLQIGADTLRAWAQQEPRLRHYDHYFARLQRRAAHVRSAEVEELLGAALDPFSTAATVHGTLTNTDLAFAPARDAAGAEHPVAQGTVNALLASADRELRRSAWQSYADAHLAFKNTMAASLAAGVKQNVFRARARRYSSALEAALEGGDLPVTVFHNLIDTFKRHLPTWHRYWRVRRRALGYDELHPYDARAPLTASPPQIPFDQAVELVSAGMRPLGEEYVEVLRRGCLEQRWVDIYPNTGKRMGAFSTGVQGTHPFILLNYTPDLAGLSVLAHELGHSLHSYHTWRAQPAIYADYGLFVAEVASNFNQAMVRAHLLEQNKDRDFQIELIEEAMSNFLRYFFIMPTLARFELEIHQRVERGEALNADALISLMASLFKEGYGDEVAVDEARVGSVWAQFSTHLYANFYVFQYATGISGAHALANRVLSGAPGAAEHYLSFLNAGSSLYPLDALRLAGVDLASPEPVEQTFKVLEGYVERLESLLET
jgi:oligoendopeptidase F